MLSVGDVSGPYDHAGRWIKHVLAPPADPFVGLVEAKGFALGCGGADGLEVHGRRPAELPQRTTDHLLA
jgi:hypothetical protein